MSSHHANETLAGAYNVSKIVNGQAIVQDVTIKVPKGEIVLLTGESGSGKSSVMRMIAGIDEPSHGHVKLFHNNLAAMSQSARTRLIAGHVGVGFQAPNLDTNLSVWDNLVGLNEAQGSPIDFQAAARTVTRLGLQEKLSDRAVNLSGGEKLLLALGRVILPKPEMLLLDEPTYALDTERKRYMFEDIAASCHEEGITALIVTHDMVPARAVADREFVMANGRLVDEIVYDRSPSASLLPA